MPASHNPIYDATLRRCIEEQYRAAECHLRAASWVARRRGAPPHADELYAATREQLIGAYHSDQARMRLDRLIGVA